MPTPMPPCDHTCWRSKPTSRAVLNSLGIQIAAIPMPGALPLEGEATCPACQWLAGYKAGYAAGRTWVVTWLEGIAGECNRDSRFAAPAAATAASILARELRKAIQEPPHA